MMDSCDWWFWLIWFASFVAGRGFALAQREERVGATKMENAMAEARSGRRQMLRYRLRVLFWLVVWLWGAVVVWAVMK